MAMLTQKELNYIIGCDQSDISSLPNFQDKKTVISKETKKISKTTHIINLLIKELKPLETFSANTIFTRLLVNNANFIKENGISKSYFYYVLNNIACGFFSIKGSQKIKHYTYIRSFETNEFFEEVSDEIKNENILKSQETKEIEKNYGYCNYMRKNSDCLGESKLFIVNEIKTIEIGTQVIESETPRVVCSNCLSKFFGVKKR